MCIREAGFTQGVCVAGTYFFPIFEQTAYICVFGGGKEGE